MTREVCTWQPVRLLCKRFGVKDPVLAVPVDTSGSSAEVMQPEFTAQRQQTNSREQARERQAENGCSGA
ncbi:hypothetical protein F4604DRAFT_1764086 [Suillus subluteus]|nr:hypothetical protein F4604DRAFT_1764086 [Suillus subluteus]